MREQILLSACQPAGEHRRVLGSRSFSSLHYSVSFLFCGKLIFRSRLFVFLRCLKMFLRSLNVFLRRHKVNLHRLKVFLRCHKINLRRFKVFLRSLNVFLRRLKVNPRCHKVK